MAPPQIPQIDLTGMDQAIASAQKESEANNPFLQAAQIPLGIKNMDPYQSAGDDLKNKIWEGVISGALSGYGQVDQGNRDKAIAQAGLGNIFGTGQNPGLAPNVWSKLDTAGRENGVAQDLMASRYKAMLDQEMALEKLHQDAELNKAVTVAKIEHPGAEGLGAQEYAKAFAEKKAAYDAANAISGGSGGILPITPDKLGDATLNMAEKISGSEPGKNYSEAKSNFDALSDLSKKDSQSAAIGMVKAAAKVMNPGAVVREGTFQILTDNPNNVTLQLQDYLNEIKGSGQLSPQHKQELMEAVKPFVLSNYKAYKGHAATLLNTFKNIGGRPEAVDLLPAPAEVRTLPDGSKVRVMLGE